MSASVPWAVARARQLRVGPYVHTKLTGVAGVDNIENGRRPLRTAAGKLLGGGPQRPGHVLDMHRVGAQVAVPQPLHLLALALVDAREAERRRDELAGVGPVDVGETQNDEIQAVDLGQVLLRLQLPLGQLEPGFELSRLLAGRRLGLVDHAGRHLDEALELAAGHLLADGDGQRVRAGAVDLVLLRVAGLAAAVEDVVELAAAGPVEDAGHILCAGTCEHALVISMRGRCSAVTAVQICKSYRIERLQRGQCGHSPAPPCAFGMGGGFFFLLLFFSRSTSADGGAATDVQGDEGKLNGKVCGRTVFGGIGLHEFVARAGFFELGRQPGELGQVLVDQPDFGRQVVLVDVQREEAADVAWMEWSAAGIWRCRRGRLTKAADDEDGGLVPARAVGGGRSRWGRGSRRGLLGRHDGGDEVCRAAEGNSGRWWPAV